MSDVDDEHAHYRRRSETRAEAKARILERLDLAPGPEGLVERALPPLPKAEEQFPDEFRRDLGDVPVSRHLLRSLHFVEPSYPDDSDGEGR